MICPKCKYERISKNDQTTPDYECPSCGIIYSQYKTDDEKSLERLNIAEAHKAAVRANNKKKMDADKDWVSGPTILIVLIVALSTVIYAALNPTPRKTIAVTPDYSVTAKQIYNEFETNEVAAFAKYNGKLVVITGKYKGSGMSLDKPFIVMDVGSMFFSVQCMFDKSKAAQVASLQKGSIINLAGKVSGQTGNIFLNNCSLY